MKHKKILLESKNNFF